RRARRSSASSATSRPATAATSPASPAARTARMRAASASRWRAPASTATPTSTAPTTRGTVPMSARSGGELRLTAIAAALAAATAAWADERDEQIAALKNPASEVSVGAGWVSNDNTRFGQYNGMVDRGVYPLLDLDLRRRDDATGTWFSIT